MNVPVIVKEVGFGMSKETFKSLVEIGVQYVDVSGRGGTNFIDIEMNVAQTKRYELFNTMGTINSRIFT